MTKGTTSRGEKHKKTHTTCRRCGHVSFHMQKGKCASCSYPDATMRRFNWSDKAKRRRTQGTGRMRSLKVVQRKARNGFKEGKTMSKKNKQVAGGASGEGMPGLE